MAERIGLEQLAKNATGVRSDKLLHGAIDMHCHGYPEVSLAVRRTLEDWEMVEIARDDGMRAIVLKSHLWPTVARAHYLRHIVPGIDTFGSITLNRSSGGLSPWAVECALIQNAKVIWMPTWSSVSDLRDGGFSAFIRGLLVMSHEKGLGEPLSILNSRASLRDEIKSILSLAKEYKACISTGHLPVDESLALAQESDKVGFTKLIFGHPLSGAVRANMDQIKEMVNRGAYAELCALEIFSSATPNAMSDALEVIDQVGAEHCLLTTDSFFEWVPPPSQFLRMFIGRLLLLGMDEESIRTMVQRNPQQLLSLPAAADINTQTSDARL
jgi:hypothetical protein